MLSLYWILANVFLFIAMLILVPFERIRKLLGYGFIGGTLLAMVIFYVANQLNLWTTVGTTKIMDIPILPSIAWFFPVIIFANFFPKSDLLISKVLYILLFGVGSVGVQYVFELFGMWKNINWNLYYTFFLALGTHAFLTLYLMYTEQYLHEEE